MIKNQKNEVEKMSKKMCDICKKSEAEIDGKTVFGPWANMCLSCHLIDGVGIGVGRGQYIKKTDAVMWDEAKQKVLTRIKLGLAKKVD